MSSSSIVIVHSSVDTLKTISEELVKYKTVCIFDRESVMWCTQNNDLQEGTRLTVYRAPQKVDGAYLSKSMVFKIVSDNTVKANEHFAIL